MTDWSFISRPFEEEYQYKSVIDVFNERVKELGDKEIFIHRFPDGTRKAITYSDLKAQAECVAEFLIQQNVCVGDNVGIFGPNSLEWIVGEVAVLMAGATSVHVVKPPGSFSGVLKFLQAADCKAVLIDTDNDTELERDIDAFLHEEIDSSDKKKPVAILLKDNQGSSLPCVRSIYDEKKLSVRISLPNICPENIAIVFLTSGSTGHPKMVEHSHFALVNTISGKALSGALDDECNGPYYNDRPFSWIGGTFVFSLMHGITRVFRDGRITLKDGGVKDLWKIVIEEKCENALFLPLTILDLLHYKDEISKTKYRLNSILTGGQIIGSHAAAIRGIFCEKFFVIYGSTEVSVVTSYDVRDEMLVGHLGTIYPGVQVKIVGDDGSPVIKGESGEICIRCPWMLQGYRKASEEHRKNLSGGWMKTGDIGFLGKAGEFIIRGRAANVIKRHTLKVLAGDVEECIDGVPGVDSVVVVGVPDARVYEEVCACVVLDKNVGVTMKDVETHCRIKLGDNITGDAPTYYLEYETLPRLPTGKPDKVQIRKDAMQKLGFKA